MDWPLCQAAIELAGEARWRGLQVRIDDGLIAATAVEADAHVATANLKHFELLGGWRVRNSPGHFGEGPVSKKRLHPSEGAGLCSFPPERRVCGCSLRLRKEQLTELPNPQPPLPQQRLVR